MLRFTMVLLYFLGFDYQMQINNKNNNNSNVHKNKDVFVYGSHYELTRNLHVKYCSICWTNSISTILVLYGLHMM